MESTFKESNKETMSQWCMIYDKRTGEIIHTHEFLALSTNEIYSEEDLGKIAIEFLSPEDKRNMEFLSVFHPPKDLQHDENTKYKINLETQSLDAERVDFTAMRMKGFKN